MRGMLDAMPRRSAPLIKASSSKQARRQPQGSVPAVHMGGERLRNERANGRVGKLML